MRVRERRLSRKHQYEEKELRIFGLTTKVKSPKVRKRVGGTGPQGQSTGNSIGETELQFIRVTKIVKMKWGRISSPGSY